MDNKVYSQEELQALFLPLLQSEGVLFIKNKRVLARKAVAGERIETITSDGLETVNTAESGDFIIQNQTKAKECYIINSKKFSDRYEYLSESAQEGYHFYKSKGEVFALEITTELLKSINLPAQFFFIAPWDEKMVVKKADFLVCQPDSSEIYRIARQEFFETYKKK